MKLAVEGNSNKKIEGEIWKCVEEMIEDQKVANDLKETFYGLLSFLKKKNKKKLSKLNLIKDFVYIAEKDLEASEKLYENKLYPHSMFFLQQSVEKTTKAFGLLTGFIEEQELYRKGRRDKRGKKETIDHISPKTFIIILKKKSARKVIALLHFLVNDPVLKDKLKNSDKGINELENLINKKEEIAMYPESMINAILNIFELCKDRFSKEIGNRKIEEIKQQLFFCLIRRLQNIKSQEKLDEEYNKLKSKIEFFLPLVPTILIITITLYFLSIITYPHFSFTRYPSKNIGPKNYCTEEQKDCTKSIGIVKSANKIFPHVREAIENLKNIINKIESQFLHGERNN